MVNKQIDIHILKKKLNRNTFIFLIIIWNITIYLPSLFLTIPAIVSLILFLQDKNLKHSFHQFFLYWAIILQCLVILLLGIYAILELVSFFTYLFNESFGFIFGQFLFFLFISLILILNLWYLKLLFTFKEMVDEEQGKVKLKGNKKEIKKVTNYEANKKKRNFEIKKKSGYKEDNKNNNKRDNKGNYKKSNKGSDNYKVKNKNYRKNKDIKVKVTNKKYYNEEKDKNRDKKNRKGKNQEIERKKKWGKYKKKDIKVKVSS